MATADLDPDALLLSRRLDGRVDDPFCFFHVDDYLPADLYAELLDAYPRDAGYSRDADGKMGFRSSEDPAAVREFCAGHAGWKALVDFFSSEAFLADTQRTFAAALRRARGLAGRRPWVSYNGRPAPGSWLRYQLREPVRTTFQFSLLPRDAAVVPHSDAPRKLVSLLLYFRDPDWEEAWGGGTEFYAPRDPARARRWGRTERIPFEEFERIGATGFRGNRLAGFVRSDASYHGVPPLACPPGRTRKALLINIKRIKWSKRHRL